MSVIKNKKNNKTIKTLKEKKSSLEASFLERPLPESEDVSRFESLIKREATIEETDNNLSAIYSDNKGELVDVSKVKKRKSLALIVFFKRIFVLTIIICGIYGAYYFFFQRPAGVDGLEFYINYPEKILAGEKMTYEIIYENNTSLSLDNVAIEAILPETFVITNSQPALNENNNLHIGSIYPAQKGSILIEGYLIAPVDSANVIIARLTYTPSNFSSAFKKEFTANTIVSSLGFLLNLDYVNTALVERSNELKLNFSAFYNNNLDDIYLTVSGPDNLKLIKEPLEEDNANNEEENAGPKFESISDYTWSISNLPKDSDERFSLPVEFTFNEKKTDKEELTLKLFKKEAENRELVLWEKTLSFDLINSDLNIDLFLNGEKSDQPINFGSTLNYSLKYANNGEAVLYDLVLMAVIKGSFIEWSSLSDSLGGSVAGKAIVWSKEQLPALAELAPGESGSIDFSIKVKSFSLGDLSGDNLVTSYAQYGLSKPAKEGDENNRSNTIRSYLNSDLSLTEKVLYFNEDNIPVGSGPLPPRVGEKTSVRVLWTLKNNLHDLKDAEAFMILPLGVTWEDNSTTNVGRVFYDADTRRVTWRLGYLPLSVYRADAEFSLSVTPSENDRDKILVLSPGSTVKAIDTLTNAEVLNKTSAKTSKLEDDEIAGLSNNGRVE